MWKRSRKPQPATDQDEVSAAKAKRLEMEMRVIKDDLDDIRGELGDRIEEVRKAIDEALAK